MTRTPNFINWRFVFIFTFEIDIREACRCHAVFTCIGGATDSLSRLQFVDNGYGQRECEKMSDFEDFRTLAANKGLI